MGLFKGIGKVVKGVVKGASKVAQVAGAVTGNPVLSAAGSIGTALTSGGGKGYTTTSGASNLFANGILAKDPNAFAVPGSTTLTPATTAAQVLTAEKQNRKIPEGTAVFTSGWYVYTDPKTGVQMKTKDQTTANNNAQGKKAATSSTGVVDVDTLTLDNKIKNALGTYDADELAREKARLAAQYAAEGENAKFVGPTEVTTTDPDTGTKVTGPDLGTEAPFTPYGVNTGFGTADTDIDTGAGKYELSPALKTFRDAYYKGASSLLPSEEDLAFGGKVQDYSRGLFTEASKMDRGQMAASYLANQLKLLEPGRAQASSELSDQMYSSGRMGFGVGMGTGGYVNPQQYAAQMARQQQDAQLGLDAEDRAVDIQDRTFQRADALFKLGSAYQTGNFEDANRLFGYGANIENLGIENMKTSMDFKTNAANLRLKSLGLSSDITNANNKLDLARDTANTQLWNTGIDAATKINWGGILNSNSGGYTPLPDTSGDYWSAS